MHRQLLPDHALLYQSWMDDKRDLKVLDPKSRFVDVFGDH